MKRQELSADLQERKLGAYGELPLTFCPAAASPARWRRARRAGWRRTRPFNGLTVDVVGTVIDAHAWMAGDPESVVSGHSAALLTRIYRRTRRGNPMASPLRACGCNGSIIPRALKV